MPDPLLVGGDVSLLPGGTLAQGERLVAGIAGPAGELPLTLPVGTSLATGHPTEPADLLSFFSVRPISRALAACGWTAGREIELLTHIAELGADDKTRIVAMDRLRLRIKEALEVEGTLRNVTQTESRVDADGTVQEIKASGNLAKTLNDLSAKFKPKELPHD